MITFGQEQPDRHWYGNAWVQTPHNSSSIIRMIETPNKWKRERKKKREKKREEKIVTHFQSILTKFFISAKISRILGSSSLLCERSRTPSSWHSARCWMSSCDWSLLWEMCRVWRWGKHAEMWSALSVRVTHENADNLKYMWLFGLLLLLNGYTHTLNRHYTVRKVSHPSPTCTHTYINACNACMCTHMHTNTHTPTHTCTYKAKQEIFLSLPFVHEQNFLRSFCRSWWSREQCRHQGRYLECTKCTAIRFTAKAQPYSSICSWVQ